MADMRQAEIPLAEDNRADAELTLRAAKKHNRTDNLVRAKDGAEALDRARQ